MTRQTSPPFDGFREDNLKLIRLPETFFTELLPVIADLTDLRVLLYLFWHLEQQQSPFRYFYFAELTADPALLHMTAGEQALSDALERLEKIGALLKATVPQREQPYYFINGPQGRAAVEAIAQGNWQESQTESVPIHLTQEQPNIFKLYEENIGAITPMMAEILKDDEKTYPPAWITEAIEIAVTRNVRNWKYIQAILERWQKEGRGNEQNRRDNSQDPSSYRESWLGRE